MKMAVHPSSNQQSTSAQIKTKELEIFKEGLYQFGLGFGKLCQKL